MPVFRGEGCLHPTIGERGGVEALRANIRLIYTLYSSSTPFSKTSHSYQNIYPCNARPSHNFPTWGTIYPEVKPPLSFQKPRYQPSKVVSMYPDSGYPFELCNQPMSSARVRELIAGLEIGPTMSRLTLSV